MIHKYKLGDYNIVLDVNSGGVHVVDELTYDMLDNVAPPFAPECPEEVVTKLSRFYDPEEVRSCYAEILEAYQEGILFSPDDYEKYANFAVASPIKAMCLNIAHDCNLRCKYCFASTGDFGEGRKLMSYETGKKAVDFLLQNSGDRVNLEMDFFGGEPLMNFETVKKIVEYARSQEPVYHKKFRFTITTNGMLLTDDKIDFINREMSNVVLSIDGRKEVNDRMRPRVDGKGSYDKIIPMYKKLVDQRGEKEYYVRGTFTRYNMDFTTDVIDMIDKGFPAVSMEPVVGEDTADYSIKEEDLPRVKAEYDRLAKLFIAREEEGRPFFFFHFNMDLWKGPCLPKRLRGCGAGHEYLAVVPNGDIYPCHQFVGREGYVIGNVYEGLKNFKMMRDFRMNHVFSKPECVDCWAKFFCSGGCHANNEAFAGDIHKPYHITCEIQKKRVECAMMIQAYNEMKKPKVMAQPGTYQAKKEAMEEK